MAAQKCQSCSRMTLDPSGLCPYHRSPRHGTAAGVTTHLPATPSPATTRPLPPLELGTKVVDDRGRTHTVVNYLPVGDDIHYILEDSDGRTHGSNRDWITAV